MQLSRKMMIFLAVGITVSLTSVGYVKYAQACRLNRVVIDNTIIENWQDKYKMLTQASILSQPLDSFSLKLLEKKSIYRVDLSYNHPGQIDIKLNDFKPVCYVLDRITGRLFGLDEQARLISIKENETGFDHPVMTSVKTKNLFKRCADPRVKVVVDQLKNLAETNSDLYRLIDEIDFGNSSYLKTAIAGMPFRLKVRTENFEEELKRFVEFNNDFNPDLSDVNLIDLRFGTMIVASGRNK